MRRKDNHVRERYLSRWKPDVHDNDTDEIRSPDEIKSTFHESITV